MSGQFEIAKKEAVALTKSRTPGTPVCGVSRGDRPILTFIFPVDGWIDEGRDEGSVCVFVCVCKCVCARLCICLAGLRVGMGIGAEHPACRRLHGRTTGRNTTPWTCHPIKGFCTQLIVLFRQGTVTICQSMI